MSLVARLSSALILVVLMIGCREATAPAGAAEGPQQQIIVKWRDGTSEQQRSTALQAATAPSGATLEYLRDTAVGGSVYKTSRTLGREAMDKVLRALEADQHVEYVEEDQMLRPMPRQ